MQSPKEFLQSEFQKRRELNPNYSLRAFARWLELSPAQLSQILAGKRSVTLKTIERIKGKLELSPASQQLLIQGVLKERKLDFAPPEPDQHQLAEDQFRLISDWYHLAILSLTRVRGAQADPRWIANRLGIRVEDANLGVQRLERMGLLQTKPTFKQIGEPFKVVSRIPSEAIRKYHKQNLALAAEKMETVDVDLRDFQSISLPTHPTAIPELKELISDFLKKAEGLSRSKVSTEVYHLNIQLFPVTESRKERK